MFPGENKNKKKPPNKQLTAVANVAGSRQKLELALHVLKGLRTKHKGIRIPTQHSPARTNGGARHVLDFTGRANGQQVAVDQRLKGLDGRGVGDLGLGQLLRGYHRSQMRARLPNQLLALLHVLKKTERKKERREKKERKKKRKRTKRSYSALLRQTKKSQTYVGLGGRVEHRQKRLDQRQSLSNGARTSIRKLHLAGLQKQKGRKEKTRKKGRKKYELGWLDVKVKSNQRGQQLQSLSAHA